MRFVGLLLLAMLALSACSEFQPRSSTYYVPVISQENDLDDWLTDLHYTRSMTPDEIQLTVKAWEQSFHVNPNNSNRIKLAMLLIVGDAQARDPKRARELLEGLETMPSNISDLEFVTILQQILDERDKANLAIYRLKDKDRIQSQRIKELEEQQRALTDIEQNIQQRDIQPDTENGGQ
jgi:hypothetical protein